MKQVPIKRQKRHSSEDAEEARGFGRVFWLKAPPFVVNPRGILTHRVRHVTTHLRNLAAGGWTESHHSFSFLCGNCTTTKGESIDKYLTDDPPKDRMLCDRCEVIAARQSLPSGDKLAGRHVHRGVLKAHRTCCKGKK